MYKEIAVPEFIGETEQAVILVVPALERDLSVLFERFQEGEEIDYWFSWELTMQNDDQYMVTLEIGWDGEDVVAIGFTLEMWEYLPVITRRSHVVLMTDWQLIEEGVAAGMDQMGRFRPRALLVRDAGQGMGALSSKVAVQAMYCKSNVELVQLLDILRDSLTSQENLH
ncbi:MAG: hypothetical protein PHT62_02910 [Desulfotomaculaceae bacterium]|nr:hypothetical protein [Desulfotomaculaceae bacterium]